MDLLHHVSHRQSTAYTLHSAASLPFSVGEDDVREVRHNDRVLPEPFSHLAVIPEKGLLNLFDKVETRIVLLGICLGIGDLHRCWHAAGRKSPRTNCGSVLLLCHKETPPTAVMSGTNTINLPPT